MASFLSRAGRTASFGAVVAALAAGCTTSSQPKGPIDVRVTEMSPELLDRIADRVADRMAGQAGQQAQPKGKAPGHPEWAPPSASVPPARATPSRRTATAPVPAPAAPTPTDADLRSLAEGIALSLDWFAAHQSESGAWSAAGFDAQCKSNQCTGAGDPNYDVGVTGLALLCFLGNGETPQSSAHGENVKRAIAYLRSQQDPQGCIGPRTSAHFMYNHAYGSLAIVEAYALTKSPALRASAQLAVDFILKAQNPYLGWRYGIRDGDNDTSATGLMVLVLRSAKVADLAVDETAFRGAQAWVDKMTEPEFGRTGYQQRGGPPARTTEMQSAFPADRSESMTAVGLATRIFSGEDPSRSEMLLKGAALLGARPPVWNTSDGSIDLYYWYWGTVAMYQTGGTHWDRWRAHLVQALPKNQRRETGRDERGSWDPVDPWSREGGRVYSTAMACLASEIASRTGR